jgi:hypothetical protein
MEPRWSDDSFILLYEKVGCQLSRFREAEDITNVANGAWFNFRVRNGFGWVPRPLAGYPATIHSNIV